MITRRRFLTRAAETAAFLGLLPTHATSTETMYDHASVPPAPRPIPEPAPRLDLTPARWIWYPSGRTLPSTVILFRRTITVGTALRAATGWIAADSRYLLTIDGRRIQWGPAPADPRRMEVDPLDLTALLTPGTHTIGVTVLYYGHGDGTHPIGKPGFIFSLDLTTADGTTETLHSDERWLCHLSRAWRPGQHKRWYVRAFQEEFDARLHPDGWDQPGFTPSTDWLPAMLLDCPATLPPSCSTYPDHLLDTMADRSTGALVPRSIPLLREHPVLVERLVEAYTITWHRPAEEYFAVLTPGAFTAEPLTVTDAGPSVWRTILAGDTARALTFAFRDQHVGFPFFTIDAPAGTIVELMVQEGHTPGGPPLLNTHFHAWARFICTGGEQTFQCFDYEAARWVQLHMHGTQGTVTVRNVGMLRRVFPWAHEPHARVNEPALQRLLDASVNTLYNSAQETAVDGMGRERQQYSGDGAHQLHSVYTTFGEHRLPARFLATFSQGLTLDGYFLDCWPAYDRLARVMERHLSLTIWGPLLDHSIGFGFDCYHHYLYTADAEAAREPFIRYQRFVRYLHDLRDETGLLPVTGLGTPAVWLDHIAYEHGKPHHKQCAFNLYAAAMLVHAFAPLARALGDEAWATFGRDLGTEILAAAVRAFWSPGEGLFVINRPWLKDGERPRLCDRSMATAVLFGQCPGNDTARALAALASPPEHMGISYPANACWRYWALARGGRTDVILRDLRERWATMASVIENNSIFENWTADPDSGDLWSHCAVVPLYILSQDIAGIRPVTPGYATCVIRPQPSDLEQVEVTVHTPHGPIGFACAGRKGHRTLRLSVPAGVTADLLLDPAEQPGLPAAPAHGDGSLRAFRVAPGMTHELVLHST